MIKLDASKLLEKEMDRKDFLLHVGAGILMLTGVSALVKGLIQQPTSSNNAISSTNSYGYGSSVYGGRANV